MPPPSEPPRGIDAICAELEATLPAGAVTDLGATVSAVAPLAATVTSAARAPTTPSFNPHRHLETLAERLGNPQEALDRLPNLSLVLEGDDRSSELRAVGVLGEGAMGRVWLAVQRSLDRDLAVKTLIDTSPASPAARALLAEGLITGQLDHPSIVPVHQLGRDARGLPALVMKRVVGVPWSQLLAEPTHPGLARFGRGSADPLDAHVEILMRVCDALEFAHRRGIVHRDLKPDNVMVGGYGEVYLVDWGVATLAHLGEPADSGAGPLVGTPLYIAPEMVAGGTVDARTDVFLLGAVLHQVLTGEPRHRGHTLKEVLARALNPERISYAAHVPGELAELAARATSARSERPPSADAFRAALDAWRQHRGSSELSRQASDRLAELEASGTATDPGLFSRLATECRFGFAQALRAWPENPVAQRGLARCLEHLVRQAIADEDLAHARGLLGELAAPPTELRIAVDGLAAHLAEREAKARRGAAFEHDRDLGVSAPLRRQVAMGFAAIATSISLTILHTRGLRGAATISPGALVLGGLGLLVFFGVITFTLRARLLANQINRQLMATLGVCFTAMFFDRVQGYLAGRSTELTLVADLQLFTAISLMAALAVQRTLLAVTVICGLSVAVATWRPELVGLLFGIAPVTSFIIVALLGPSRGVTRPPV